jgi:uncharacterized protein
LDIREANGVVTVRVRVQPRASRDLVGGSRGEALLVRLTAPPVEGAANEALARVLGRALGVPASAVQLLHGASGREKLVRIEGATALQVRALAGPPQPSAGSENEPGGSGR